MSCMQPMLRSSLPESCFSSSSSSSISTDCDAAPPIDIQQVTPVDADIGLRYTVSFGIQYLSRTEQHARIYVQIAGVLVISVGGWQASDKHAYQLQQKAIIDATRVTKQLLCKVAACWVTEPHAVLHKAINLVSIAIPAECAAPGYPQGYS